MKVLALAVAAVGLFAGTASAQSWEAVAAADSAVMAVDWKSLSIDRTNRSVTLAVVPNAAGAASAGFDYGVTSVTIDCTTPRYRTNYSDFYYLNGQASTERFTGDGSWENINDGSLILDVRTEVCSSNASRPGFFHDAITFAGAARTILDQQ